MIPLPISTWSVTGNHFSKVAEMFRFMNLGVVNVSTCRLLQLNVVRPVIMEKKEAVIMQNCQEAQMKSPNGLVVAGNEIRN